MGGRYTFFFLILISSSIDLVPSSSVHLPLPPSLLILPLSSYLCFIFYPFHFFILSSSTLFFLHYILFNRMSEPESFSSVIYHETILIITSPSYLILLPSSFVHLVSEFPFVLYSHVLFHLYNLQPLTRSSTQRRI